MTDWEHDAIGCLVAERVHAALEQYGPLSFQAIRDMARPKSWPWSDELLARVLDRLGAQGSVKQVTHRSPNGKVRVIYDWVPEIDSGETLLAALEDAALEPRYFEEHDK